VKLTNKCRNCGKRILAIYTLCYNCHLMHYGHIRQSAEQTVFYFDENREVSPDEYCVMCGKEWGTSLRSDGKYYCATCWGVWNS